MVEEIANDAAFIEALAAVKQANSKLVIDFTASWCGPCKAIAPIYTELAQQLGGKIRFLKVDIDKCKVSAASLQVTSVPTFRFFVGDTPLAVFSGASREKLVANVEKMLKSDDKSELLAMFKQGGDDEEGGDPEIDLSSRDCNLFPGVDLTRSEVLNNEPEHTLEDLFDEKEDTYVRSDCDEQLLINIGFKKIVSLKTIKFTCVQDGEDESGPKKVKIFVNRLNMGFSECEDLTPAQVLVLTSDDLAPTSSPIKLDYLKFVKTDVVTIFVESNQKDTLQTSINQLVLVGRAQK